ncbi:MAG: hypothetical protein U9R19_14000 [Bacteroidota bacterium]|nr:hypothetical protein [Bacteroidota bacterium]
MEFDYYYYNQAESELKKKIEIMSGGKDSHYYKNSLVCLNDMRKEIVEFEEKVNDKFDEYETKEIIDLRAKIQSLEDEAV